jgi:hypothetical protein
VAEFFPIAVDAPPDFGGLVIWGMPTLSLCASSARTDSSRIAVRISLMLVVPRIRCGFPMPLGA